MGIFSNTNDFFALDIGTTALRVVKLRGNNPKTLERFGMLPIDRRVSQSDSAKDKSAVLAAVKEIIQQTGITTKNVVVGVPSNKMFSTVVDFPSLNEKELDKTIKYQADQFIPTKLDDSKIDYAVLGQSVSDPNKSEVLLASVDKKYAEERLDMLESIGLNVLAMEPDAFALARALVKSDAMEATMVLDIGNSSTDLIILYQNNPRLVRSIPIGGETLLRATMQNLSIDEKQANQFIYKFGLMQDKLEGQVFKSIMPTIESLLGEVEKSINFFTSKYQNVPLSKIVVTGRGSVLPDFPVFLVNKTNISVEIGNSWQNVSFPQEKYNDLMAVSNQYSVAVGLAERNL